MSGTKSRTSPRGSRRGEVLVAILPTRADFAILREQGWYRIPREKAPRRWPPRWMAFYQTKDFGAEAFAVKYYGRVREIRLVARRALFPNDPPNPKTEREYYQIWLESLERLERPIPSRRLRRVLFIPTTWRKLHTATEINDLYDDSPLEDALWAELKRLEIAAERQWGIELSDAFYFLDFALFCARGKLDLETDGDRWHADPARIPADNRRNNALAAGGWQVLRFNTAQIREEMAEYCVPAITETINRLGGLSDDGLIGRRFVSAPEGIGQQLALFEEASAYGAE